MLPGNIAYGENDPLLLNRNLMARFRNIWDTILWVSQSGVMLITGHVRCRDLENHAYGIVIRYTGFCEASGFYGGVALALP